MPKIKKTYEEYNMLALNLMGIKHSGKLRLSNAELFCVIFPLALSVLTMISLFVPELGFIITCENVPGGDLCAISMR